MRILHVIPSVSDAHGGPSRAVREMTLALQAHGHCMEIATTDDDGPGRRGCREVLGQDLPAAGVKLHYFPKQTEFYKVSLPLARWLRAHAKDYDVIHIHALFSFSSLVAARAARRAGVPCVIRPLGVLNQYGMTRRRAILKKWSLRLLEARHLREAAAIHFTTRAEMTEAQSLGVPFHGVVIPLGVSVPPVEGKPPARESSGKQAVLFLSRLDPVKNIESLLRAWASLAPFHEAWQLTIAGAGDPEYTASLQRLAGSLGLDGSIHWAGAVSGDAKWSLMRGCSLFVLPSHSENFGIAAVEAMMCGRPCLLAGGVAVATEAAAAGACVVSGPESENLAGALRTLMLDPELRQTTATRALTFSADHYTPEAMAVALTRLYQDSLKMEPSPLPVLATN